MKKILFLLVMSVMVLSVGVVSAACFSDDIEIVSPTADSYTNTNTQLVNWTLDADCNSDTFSLRFSVGACENVEQTLGLFASGETEFNWDISSLSSGPYCVKVYKSTSPTVKNEVSFTIDRVSPNITFTDTPYFVIVNASITIKATLDDSNLVDNYTIDFGDGVVKEVDITDASSYSLSEAYTYNTSGQYTVTITARDNAGNSVMETNIVTVNAESPDWIIELSSENMNMFSIPLRPENTNIGSVLPESVSDNANKIWAYQQGAWKYNTPTSSGWTTSDARLQEIVPGYGYLLFMNEDAIAYGNGKDLGKDLPPEVTLTTGWNLIGHYGLNTDVDVNQAFYSLWLGENDYWHNLLTLDSEGNFQNLVGTDTLEPTEAYWLSIKSLNLAENELRYFTYFPAQETY